MDRGLLLLLACGKKMESDLSIVPFRTSLSCMPHVLQLKLLYSLIYTSKDVEK